MLHVSALASREIQLLVLTLREAEPEIRKAINKASKDTITTIWKQQILETSNATGGKTQKARIKLIAKTAKVTVGNKGVTLTAATTGQPLSGGLSGKTNWQGLEFGATADKATVSFTNGAGTQYTQVRNVFAQLDFRRKKGYLFYPAARKAVPRILSLWVQTSVRTLFDLVEGRR